MTSAESAGAEVTTLREERDLIKSRVTDMLKQLDGRPVNPVPDLMAEPKVVNVEVHGQKYPIKTELDARYVEELAEFVEARMALAAAQLALERRRRPGDPDRAQHHRRVLPDADPP